jgi:DNA-binding response OmpR family regulator
VRGTARCMPDLVLLTNGDKKELQQIECVLAAAGYLVACAASLRRATRLLTSVIPELLIASARLRNHADLEGLELARLSRRDHPNLPVIITHGSSDAGLENEVTVRGMAFIVNPIENPEFLGCVTVSLGERRPHLGKIRQWPRKRVAAVPVRVDASPARLLDVSYEGLRLQLEDPGDSPAATFEVTLPTAGVNLKTRRVWRIRSPDADESCWGMTLVDVNSGLTERWRQFVDSIPETTSGAP